MRIGELATRAGVSVRALRYYEERKLLASERTPSGQRRYPESAVDRVRLIQQLYAAGLASRTIVELLPCVDTGVATPTMVARMAAERDRIDEQIGELVSARDRLDALIASAGGARQSSAGGRGDVGADLGRPSSSRTAAGRRGAVRSR